MKLRHVPPNQHQNAHRLWQIVPLLVLALGSPSFAAPPVSAATFFGSPQFEQQYAMGEAITPNFWGPLTSAHEPQVEAYVEGSAGAICHPIQACAQYTAVGRRRVQYFDKARMEQNSAGSPVTNGLLAVELISGRVQTGNAKYEPRQPATITAVGDPGSAFPTYADFARWQTATSPHTGPVVTLAQPDGSTSTYAGAMIDPLTVIGATDTGGMHAIPLAFSQFRDKAGLSTIGLAITEPVWVRVNVGGMPRTVLVQAFERRVLTYTPDNPDPYKVEFGNIGAHYYQWRYPGG